MRGVEYAEPATLVRIIGELYAYFREEDYDWTMRREETWAAAMGTFTREPWHARHMSSLEAIELVRSLYRYLIPLAIELPPADIYHASVAGFCGIAAIAAKHVHGTPVILTEHGVYLRERVLALARAGFPFSDRAIKKNFFSGIARATYDASDVIAPVCRYNTTWEKYYGVPEERLRVIYNGVDEARFDDRAIDPDRPTVSAVLRIDPLKDVPTMIASAVTARASVPNVVYKLWGPALDPEYLAICEKLIVDLGLTETVFLMGPTRDPASAYADAHVVALSSISEGFPFSIIEAMMCAKPVVATDVGGVREAVDRFGAVVPPKRPELLGEAIAALLRDPARARALGKEARDFALEHFTRRRFPRRLSFLVPFGRGDGGHRRDRAGLRGGRAAPPTNRLGGAQRRCDLPPGSVRYRLASQRRRRGGDPARVARLQCRGRRRPLVSVAVRIGHGRHARDRPVRQRRRARRDARRFVVSPRLPRLRDRRALLRSVDRRGARAWPCSAARLWSSLSTPLHLATGIALGVYGALIIAGAFSQAIARRLTFYFLQDNVPLMLWTLNRFIALALATFAGVGLVAWLLLRRWYGDPDAWLAASFFVGSGIFQTSLAPLYTVRKFTWIVAISLFATLLTGVTFAGFFHRSIDLPWEPATLAGEIALVGLAVMIGTHEWLRRTSTGDETGAAHIAPAPGAVAVSAWPYALFGAAYFTMIVLDRISAGLSNGRPFAYNSGYELGCDVALLSIIPVIGVVNVALESLPRRILAGSTSRIALHGSLDVAMARFYVLAAASVVVAAVLAVGVAELLANRVFDHTLLGLQSAEGDEARFVLRYAAAGYGLLMLALLNCQFLFFLSRPGQAVAASVAGAPDVRCRLRFRRVARTAAGNVRVRARRCDRDLRVVDDDRRISYDGSLYVRVLRRLLTLIKG